jgi:hypothetical protein
LVHEGLHADDVQGGAQTLDGGLEHTEVDPEHD